MAGLLEYTKNGQVTEPPLYRFMRGNVQSFLNSIPDPSKMTPEQQLAMGLNANPIMGLLGTTAYHGSPYLFEQFDPRKVGTGVGQNAFGQGTYFSESQDIAKEYLAPKANSAASNFLYKDKPIDPSDEAKRSAAYFLNYFKGDKDAILNMYKPEYYQSGGGKQFKKYIETMDVADIKPAGTLYKVDIPDKDIPKMLQWDKPIKDQPEIFNLIKSNIKDDDIRKSFESNAKSGITGSNAYLNYIGGKTDSEKSKNALDLGIKGIRYLDPKYINKDFEPYIQNYVVFDPTEVKILEKGLLK